MANPESKVHWATTLSWRWIILLSAATLFMVAKVKSYEDDLVPFRMADFELTYTASRADEILAQWDQLPAPEPDCDDRCIAQRSIYWDDAFIPFYVALLLLLAVRAAAALAGRYDDRYKKWAILAGKVVTYGILVAGVCDYVENWGMGALLQAPQGTAPSQVIVSVASWSALLKFSLLGLAGIFCVAVGGTTVIARRALRLLARLWMHLLLVVGLALMLVFVGQAQDIIRALADDAVSGDWLHAALFYLALAVWSVFGWYWSRFILVFRHGLGAVAAPDSGSDPVAIWLPRLIAACGGVFVGLAFERAAGWASSPSARIVLYLGGLVAIAISLASVAYFASADKRQGPRQTRVAPLPFQHESLKEAENPVKFMLWLGLIFAMVLSAGFFFFPVQFGQALGPGATVILCASVGLPVVSALEYVGTHYRISIPLVVVTLGVIDGTFDDSHKLRVLARDQNIQRPDAPGRMAQWFEQVPEPRPPTASRPMYVVATEGGGIRAAYWTASALARLADTGGAEFANHLFAISAVSGGSLGAAVYAAELAAPPQGDMTADVQKVLGKDLLSPTLGSFATVDLPGTFLPSIPLIEARDRAFALERAFEEAWRRTPNPIEGDFLALWQKPARGWVPSLFLNATLSEDGNRMITSDLRIQSSKFPDAHDTFDQRARIRLSTAAHLSARFPYVSPGASLPLESHAVDGGYFDNSGATTLGDMLAVLHDGFPDKLGADVQGKVRACDGPGTICPIVLIITNGEPPATAPPLREFAQARIPPHAVLATQSSRGYYAVDQLRRESQLNHWRCVQLRLQDEHDTLPLGWALSRSAQDEMNKQANLIEFAKLAAPPPCDKSTENVCSCDLPAPVQAPAAPLKVVTEPVP